MGRIRRVLGLQSKKREAPKASQRTSQAQPRVAFDGEPLFLEDPPATAGDTVMQRLPNTPFAAEKVSSSGSGEPEAARAATAPPNEAEAVMRGAKTPNPRHGSDDAALAYVVAAPQADGHHHQDLRV